MLDVVDEKIIPAAPAVVFRELEAMGRGEAEWFLPHLRIKPLSGEALHVGSRAHVHVRRGPSFTTSVATIEPDHLLQLSYVKGAFRGDGLWTVEAVGDGTRVRLHWHAIPHGIWRLLARVVNIPKAHSRVIQAGLDGLARKLTPR